MGQAQINVRTRACSRTSIARTKQAALTHNVRGKELTSIQMDTTNHWQPVTGSTRTQAVANWGLQVRLIGAMPWYSDKYYIQYRTSTQRFQPPCTLSSSRRWCAFLRTDDRMFGVAKLWLKKTARWNKYRKCWSLQFLGINRRFAYDME